MATMRPVFRFVLLVAIVGILLLGLVAGLAYQAMLAATIGGLMLTDWWKWTWVALLTLPIWLLYRAVFARRKQA
jgi:hypothetical protein